MPRVPSETRDEIQKRLAKAPPKPEKAKPADKAKPARAKAAKKS